MFASKRWLIPVVLMGGVVSLGTLNGCCTLRLKSCPTQDQLEFVGDAKLNSCSGDDRSYPVGVRVYYLTDKDAFETAELPKLWEGEREVLGGSLLGSIAADLTIEPGAAPMLWQSPRPAGAVWIGIAAGFCKLDGASWRRTIRLDKGVYARVSLKEVRMEILPSDR